MKYRLRSGVLFSALMVAPSTLFLAWAAIVNPWFLDDLATWVLLAVLPLAALGGLLGLALARGRRGWILWVPQLLVVVGAAARPVPGPVDTRLLVYGIDGATWNVIDRIQLPVLDRLQARGARAVLQSEEPMFSPLLWTTIATGKRPDQHGIRGFRTRSDHCGAARFWEVAASHDLPVGVYKWLVSWPPRSFPAGGFMVPAWLAPSPETWPEDLSFVKELELSQRTHRKRLEDAPPAWWLALRGIPEGLRWSTLVKAGVLTLGQRMAPSPGPERSWQAQLMRVQIDRDVFISALHEHEPAVATFTTYATDALGHTHWALMERCSRALGGSPEGCPAWASAVPDAYRQADAVLGEILANMGPEVTVVVLSDHGFRAMAEGDAARHFAPLTERLRVRVSEEVGPVDVARLGHKVVLTLLAEDREAERAALETWLADLVQGSTGKPFYVWEDLPEGAVGLTLRDEAIDADRLKQDTVGGELLESYARLTEQYSGEHDAAGIFLAAGPGVPEGRKLAPAGLLDVAPTLLALLDLPGASDLPGRALFGEKQARVASWDHLAYARQPGADQGKGGDEDVDVEALKALGYVE